MIIVKKQDIVAENTTNTQLYLTRTLQSAVSMCRRSKKVEDIFIIGGVELFNTTLESYELDEIVYIMVSTPNTFSKHKFPLDTWETLVNDAETVSTTTNEYTENGTKILVINEKFTFDQDDHFSN